MILFETSFLLLFFIFMYENLLFDQFFFSFYTFFFMVFYRNSHKWVYYIYKRKNNKKSFFYDDRSLLFIIHLSNNIAIYRSKLGFIFILFETFFQFYLVWGHWSVSLSSVDVFLAKVTTFWVFSQKSLLYQPTHCGFGWCFLCHYA